MTTVNDVYATIVGNLTTLHMKIGMGQRSKTFILLGNVKIQETMESEFSIELTQFNNPLRGSVLRVRCIVQDTQGSGLSFVEFKLSGGPSEFNSVLQDPINPIGSTIAYTYRILFL